MKATEINLNKRRLLGAIGAGIVALPLLQLLGCSPAETPSTLPPAPVPPASEAAPEANAPDASGLPDGVKAANPNDALPKALGYYEDTNAVDAAKFPKHKKEQNCANCSFYTKLNDKWGNCTMIASGAVTAAGWCNSYQLKA